MHTKTNRLILLAFGSRDPRWQKPFLHLQDKLAGEIGDERVALAYLENCKPSLMDAVQAAMEASVTDVIILPLFLALGDEVEQEIPRQVVELKERFPQIGIVLLPPIGEHPLVAEAIYQVAKASAG